MKKKLKSMKGFAMAELLAVSMVVLLIFSILFSNYLPLVAEYENRLNYNNTSAQFAAYYARKIYIELLINDREFSIISNNINSNGFYTTYSTKDDHFYICNNDVPKLGNGMYDIFGTRSANYASSRCQSIFGEYGIEEMILTKYKLTDVKSKYKQNNGTLYNYIQYLPEYKNTVYQGDNELYRIIIKTKDGYATTPIVADYYTPGSCFDTERNSSGLTVTKYHQNKDDCSSNVVFASNRIKSNNNQTGVITEIGDGAFKGTEITGVDFKKSSVTTIGEKAFENVGTFDGELALGGIESVGANAFNGTSVYYLTLGDNTVPEAEAFAGMNELQTVKNVNSNIFKVSRLFKSSGSDSESNYGIKFYDNVKNPIIIGDGTFSNAILGSDAQTLKFLNNITEVGASAFENAKFGSPNKIKFSSLTKVGKESFKNSYVTPSFDKVSVIEDNAFECANSLCISSISASLSSVTTIGKEAFKNRPISTLVLGNSINKISDSAFEGSNISSNLTIPSNITTIGNKAFSGNSFGTITLNSGLTTIGEEAFLNNSFKTIIIPSTVTSIGDSAFKGCSDIEIVTVNSSVYSSDKNKWCSLFGYTSGCEVESQDTSTWYLKAGDRNIAILYKGGATSEQ